MTLDLHTQGFLDALHRIDARKKKKIGSLFSGYGGLDLAVSKVLNAEVAWHCEWEDAPSKVLEAHFPGVPNYRDVSKVDWDSVEPVDILTGGFPCQDLSLAGKRAGMQEGTRSGLWSEFYKAITILKPKMVVIENVRGLLSAKADSGMEYETEIMEQAERGTVLRALGAVLGDLADIGYDAKWRRSSFRCRSAAPAFPSLHHSLPKRGGGQSLPTPTVSDQYTGNLSSTQQKPGSMHSVTLAQVFHKAELFPTPTTRDYKDGSADHERDGKVQTDTVARAIFSSGEIALMGTPRTSSANGSTPKQVALGAPKSRIEDQVKLFPTLRASDSYERRNQKTMDRIAKDGGDMTMTTLARTETNWGKFEPAIRRWEAVIGRPAPEPTKPDGKDGNHRLSSKFTEWMMGLPDNWITGHDLKRNDELKLAGNGVVPQQAELALRLLLEER
jgi:DNA (cytosine-5)-methyltransferase 1